MENDSRDTEPAERLDLIEGMISERRRSNGHRGSIKRAWWVVGIAMLLAPSVVIVAQGPAQNGADAQREAMQKLAFLAGHWSGPLTVQAGPGAPLHLTQTENVQFKLDGLVMLIEGRSTDATGKAQFEALATVAYDEASQSYHIRAYHDGHYVDAPLTVTADGFSWGFKAGPAQVENTMRLTAKGEWQESTDVTVGDRPAQRSVEMLLTREP
ncbi:MAG TPA: hypothetical protein VMD29_14840 [Terracidiphilus sp.]|nr:hypothetical protein [Terracidiphilus sp.]